VLRILFGLLLGVGVTIVLLLSANKVLAWQTAPKEHAMDHWVIYLSLVLGAGFGALTAATYRKDGTTGPDTQAR
jgi:hypothetical protein